MSWRLLVPVCRTSDHLRAPPSVDAFKNWSFVFHKAFSDWSEFITLINVCFTLLVCCFIASFLLLYCALWYLFTNVKFVVNKICWHFHLSRLFENHCPTGCFPVSALSLKYVLGSHVCLKGDWQAAFSCLSEHCTGVLLLKKKEILTYAKEGGFPPLCNTFFLHTSDEVWRPCLSQVTIYTSVAIRVPNFVASFWWEQGSVNRWNFKAITVSWFWKRRKDSRSNGFRKGKLWLLLVAKTGAEGHFT